MVDDRVILACATTAEARAGRRAGFRTALVGLAGRNGIPEGELVSFGLAGALDGLTAGTVVDATRVVDERGETLWEGPGLGAPGAVPGTILASDRVIDDPGERLRLYERTGADAVDMESGVLAETGRLRGCLRAISDTPERTLHGVCDLVTPEGRLSWPGLLKGLAKGRLGLVRAAGDARRALGALTRAAQEWRT